MRQRFLACFLLTSLATVSAFAVRPSRESSSPELSFSNPIANVITVYGQISQRSGPDRNSLFSRLPATMKADVWMLHLKYFLDDHYDLTPRQLGVVYEGAGFIAAGAFNVDRDDPSWNTKVNLPLKNFETRALAAFGGKLAFAAFAHLGAEEPDQIMFTTLPRVTLGSGDVSVAGGSMPACECSTQDDWCCVGDCLTSPSPKCHAATDRCTPHTDCGWFFLSGCNGFCGA